MIKRSKYLFIAPLFLLVFLIFVYPVSNVLIFSLFHMGFVGKRSFVGIENYKYLFDPEFHSMFIKTVIYLFGAVPISVILGCLAAMLFNQDFPGCRILRTLFFIPWLIPEAILAVMWRWTLHPGYGFINNVLVSLGVTKEGISFFSLEGAMFWVIIVRIWRSTPFAYICILSALQSIPLEVLEAAILDGASPLQKLLWIILPLIKFVMVVVAIMLTIWTVIVFDQLYVLTGGGPIDATRIFTIDIYLKAFAQQNVGLAYFVSVAGLIFLMLLGLIYQRLVRS